MSEMQITIYLTEVVDGWVAWNGLTWDEHSGAIVDPDPEQAVARFKQELLRKMPSTEMNRVEFHVLEE